MIILATAAALFGVALGMRYKILVLMVAMSCLGLGIVISALVFPSTLLNLFLTLALVFTGLELGYIVGAVGRHRSASLVHRTVSTPRYNLVGLRVK
jgi:hypothetical protein